MIRIIINISTVISIITKICFCQTGTVFTHSFTHFDTTRTYKTYTPATYTGQNAWPVIINFHGYTHTADLHMNYTVMNVDADTAEFLVVYPQGLVVTDLIWGDSDYGWNVPGAYSAGHNDISFTEELINDIKSNYNVDSSRIHVTGFSTGAEMVFYLGCVLADKVASVAGVSGGLYYHHLDSLQPSRPISALVIFGTDDPWFPEAGDQNYPPIAATPSFFAHANGCISDSLVTDLPNINTEDSSTVTLITYQNCEAETEVLFYRINNGKHRWPGVTTPGLSNRDISANDEIMKFFQANPHPTGAVQIDDHDFSGIAEPSLYENHPNPFNPTTTINYDLPEISNVNITIYDVTGREVVTLENEEQLAGHYEINWSGVDQSGNQVTTGVYFTRLQAGQYSQTIKMLYLK